MKRRKARKLFTFQFSDLPHYQGVLCAGTQVLTTNLTISELAPTVETDTIVVRLHLGVVNVPFKGTENGKLVGLLLEALTVVTK